MAGGGDDGAEMTQLMEYLERLKNYERVGVPKGAGTESDDGFDLGRMRRLLGHLGDPHMHYKVSDCFIGSCQLSSTGSPQFFVC